MGVDIKTYGARIGRSMLDNAVESIVLNCGMKMNPGYPDEQVRIGQILA
jgi:hypothetical protein